MASSARPCSAGAVGASFASTRRLRRSKRGASPAQLRPAKNRVRIHKSRRLLVSVSRQPGSERRSLRSLGDRPIQNPLPRRHQRHQGSRKPRPQPRDEVRNLRYAGYRKEGSKQEHAHLWTPYTAAQIAEPSRTENNYNCQGMVGIDYSKPGAQEFTDSWVDRLAAWGVDYIKIDGIQDSNVADIKAWSMAIRQSGRPMVLDVTQGTYTSAIAPVLMKYANQWEFAPDIECYKCEKEDNSYPLTTWAHVENRFNYVAEWQPYAGPGGFNDYDSIEWERQRRRAYSSRTSNSDQPLVSGSIAPHPRRRSYSPQPAGYEIP